MQGGKNTTMANQIARPSRVLSRRRWLIATTAGAVAVVVAACSNQAQTPSPTSAPAAAQPTSAAAQPTSAAAQPTVSAGSPTAAASPGTTPAAAGAPATPNASLKGTSLAFVGGSYFIPEAQTLFQNQLKQWGSENGVNVTADFLNWPDLQAKIAAAVQSGGGGDMFELWPGWAYLYTANLVDVSDIAEAFGKAQDGFYDGWVLPSVQVDNKWYGVPTGATNVALAYRISYFKKAGIDDPEKSFPDTWDDFFAVGKKLKAMGKPLGQALGHSLGDPPGFCYPYMWANGAMEVEKDGKTVAFDTPTFVDAMKKFIQAWKDAYDTTALNGDDGYNNRAYLADQISATLNGSSIYAAALKQSPDIASDTSHADIPRGPSGRFYDFGSHSFAVLKASKNVAGAKAFLSWWFDKKQFGDWLHVQNTYQIPPTKAWANDPMWTKDPKLAAFSNDTKYGRLLGYAGPPNQKAALARSKFIIIDVFSRAVQSGDAEGEIKKGAEQLKEIYGG
jgi:multiple sugar transport system substrate-binding protein